MLKRENGNATIEFAMFFPILITFLLSSVEIGVLTIRQVMLERAVDLAVRDLRLGKIPNPTQSKLRDLICARSAVVPDCRNNLLIELQPVSAASWAALSADVTCRDKNLNVDPVVTLEIGVSHQMVLIRVCAVFDPIFPTTKLGIHLVNDDVGGYALVSSSAFVNEPHEV
ncbi:hypothetical protein JI58_05715 [Marinosulfonomonas sp. PRT-SC04]|nr:hypothetical protein JI58_05715 [Marinosulfonomonas sp. PRT-SC04]